MQEGLAAGMILLGALIGSPVASTLADRYGRRKALMIAAFLYIVCNLPFLFLSHFSLFLLCRFATGIAVGITSLTVPLYLAEIAPPSRRGAFVSLFQLAVTMGTMGAYFVNWMFASSGNWRAMFLCTIIPAFLQGVCLFFIPESAPPCLREEKASSWQTLFSPLFRKGLWIGALLVLFQQWGGINAIIYFTPLIFQEAGLASVSQGITITLGFGAANVLATLFALFFIDRAGRRLLLLVSQAGAFVSLVALSCSFVLPDGSFLAPWALVSFMVFFAIGLGPIPWVLISEIYPLKIRAKAIGAMTFICWLSNFIVVATFPSWLDSWGFAQIFGFYAFVGALAFFCFWRSVPETKGKTLEEIEFFLYR